MRDALAPSAEAGCVATPRGGASLTADGGGRSAATAASLPPTHTHTTPHTRWLRYFEAPPGLQLLHCLKNAAVGGESTFADGFKAAEVLAHEHPNYHVVRLSTPVRRACATARHAH